MLRTFRHLQAIFVGKRELEMQLVILGANGRTGRLVTRLSLDRGHAVTTVVRNVSRQPDIRHPRLSYVVGDPCDPSFLTGVFRDHDAVISTLGGRLPTKSATAVYPRSARAIAQAAHNTGVRRIVVTSTALLFPSNRMFDRILKAGVRNVVQSATRMEEILSAADLDLTIARCGFLTNAREKRYRASGDALPENGSSVSRAGLAHFLMDCVEGSFRDCRVYGISAPAHS